MANITFLLSSRNLLQLIRLNRLLARVGFAGLFILSVGAASALAAEGPVFPPLTSVSGNPRLPGKFVWADLVTDDVPAARKFYGSLFGWTFREIGNYSIAS